MSKESVSETEAENQCKDWNIVKTNSVDAGKWTKDLSLPRRALYPYTNTTALTSEGRSFNSSTIHKTNRTSQT